MRSLFLINNTEYSVEASDVSAIVFIHSFPSKSGGYVSRSHLVRYVYLLVDQQF
jgi:hypothetical protein